MKRIALLLVTACSLILFSCNQAELQRIAELESRVDSLTVQSEQKDATINEFFESLNQIEENLKLITSKEQQISTEVRNNGTNNELPEDGRERIAKDIIDINRIMSENHSKLAALTKKLKASNMKVAEFEKMIKDMTRRIEERDSTIQTLRDNLEVLNFSVDSLTIALSGLDSVNKELIEQLEQQHVQINEAWYAFGSKKELIENQIISRTGGFLGIGKHNELKEDMLLDYFTKISIETTNEIPIFATKKGVEFVTKHPTDSYELTTNDEGAIVSIKITDKTKFWRQSRYLVVIIK